MPVTQFATQKNLTEEGNTFLDLHVIPCLFLVYCGGSVTAAQYRPGVTTTMFWTFLCCYSPGPCGRGYICIVVCLPFFFFQMDLIQSRLNIQI